MLNRDKEPQCVRCFFLFPVFLAWHLVLRKTEQSECSSHPAPSWFHFFSDSGTHSDTHTFFIADVTALSGPQIPPPVSFSLHHNTIQNTTTTPHPHLHFHLHPLTPNSILLNSDSEPTEAVLRGVEPSNEVKSSIRFFCLSFWKKRCPPVQLTWIQVGKKYYTQDYFKLLDSRKPTQSCGSSWNTHNM